MKIMALNLHSYQQDNQLEKFKKIAMKIVEEKVDVICCSEALQRINTAYVDESVREDNALKIICDFINEQSNQHYHYQWAFSHFGCNIYEEGIGIITHLPVHSVECRYVSQTEDVFSFKSRKVMKVVIEDSGHLVNLFSVHLGWGDDEYEPFDVQIENLDAWIKETPDMTSFIAGDFNNDIDTRYYDMIVRKNYIDQYIQAKPEGLHDYTFINPSGLEFKNSRKLRLDYLFTSNNEYRAVEAKRFFLDEDSVSDHAAICIELKPNR